MVSRSWTAALASGVFLAALALYLLTLAPTITWRFAGSDSGELASAAYTWGVAHPTGYPLWTLLGFLITRIPVADPAARTSFLSALCGAAAAALAALSVLRLTSALSPRPAPLLRILASAGAGLALASAPAFWSQSILTETYSLNALLIAVIVWLLAAGIGGRVSGVGPAPPSASSEISMTFVGHRTPKETGGGDADAHSAETDARPHPPRHPTLDTRHPPVYCLAFACGLALTNHSTAIFAVLAAAVAVWLRSRGKRPAPRTLVYSLLLFLAPLALYLLIPWRAAQHPAENWSDPQTLSRFLQLVSGAQYHYLLAWRDPIAALRSLPAIVRLFLGQFAWWGVPLAIYGLLAVAAADAPFAILSLSMLVLYTAFTAVYRAQGMERYLLPAYLIEAVLIGCGLAALAAELSVWARRRSLPPGAAAVLLSALVLLSVIPFAAYHFSSHNLRHDYAAYDYARSTLTVAAPHATIASDSDEHTFSLWYLQKVEHVRRDVQVVDTRLVKAGLTAREDAAPAGAGAAAPAAVCRDSRCLVRQEW